MYIGAAVYRICAIVIDCTVFNVLMWVSFVQFCVFLSVIYLYHFVLSLDAYLRN